MSGVHHQVVGHTSNQAESVAIQIEPSEKTPLIGKKPVKNVAKTSLKACLSWDIRAILIGFLLIVGTAIASYLLVIDTRIPPVRFAFDFVSRDAWSAFPLAYLGSSLLNPSNILHVLIFHTRGDNCNDMDSCVQLLRTMETSQRSENAEIPYNFMIGGDGQTYEGRGWNHLSGFQFIPKENSLVIGIIGNFTELNPPREQLNAAAALIQESVYRRKIRRDFRLYGVQNLTISHTDGHALFQAVSRWTNFDTLLKML